MKPTTPKPLFTELTAEQASSAQGGCCSRSCRPRCCGYRVSDFYSIGAFGGQNVNVNVAIDD